MKLSKSPRILNFGSINIDHVYMTQEFVKPGETIAVEKYSIFAGGKGLNQSIAMARAESRVQHIGNTGEDGDWLVKLMQAEGIDTSLVGQVEEPTGHAVIEIDGKGENRILISHGANHCLTTSRIASAMQGEAGLVVVQNEVNLVPAILEQAKEAGHRTALNAAPCDAGLSRVSFQSVDILIVNQLELAALSGEQDQAMAVSCLQECNPAMEIIVTLGAGGAMAIAGAEHRQQRALEVEVLDTTAAGDTFVGFYLSERCRDRPIPDCLKLASHASALTIQKKGAARSIPGLAQVKASIRNDKTLC